MCCGFLSRWRPPGCRWRATRSSGGCWARPGRGVRPWCGSCSACRSRRCSSWWPPWWAAAVAAATGASCWPAPWAAARRSSPPPRCWFPCAVELRARHRVPAEFDPLAALIGLAFGEPAPPLKWLGLALVTLGLGIGWPRQVEAGWAVSAAMLGLAAGAGFALSANAFRQAALIVEPRAPVFAALAALLVAQAMQSAALAAWLGATDRGALRSVRTRWRESLPAGFSAPPRPASGSRPSPSRRPVRSARSASSRCRSPPWRDGGCSPNAWRPGRCWCSGRSPSECASRRSAEGPDGACRSIGRIVLLDKSYRRFSAWVRVVALER